MKTEEKSALLAIIIIGAIIVGLYGSNLLAFMNVNSMSYTFAQGDSILPTADNKLVYSVKPSSVLHIIGYGGEVREREQSLGLKKPLVAIFIDNQNPEFIGCNPYYPPEYPSVPATYKCEGNVILPATNGQHIIKLATSNYNLFQCFAATKNLYDTYYATGRIPTADEYMGSVAYFQQNSKFGGIVAEAGKNSQGENLCPVLSLKSGNEDCSFDGGRFKVYRGLDNGLPRYYYPDTCTWDGQILNNILNNYRDLAEKNYEFTITSGCTIDNQCATGQACVNGLCIELPKPECTSNSDCATGYFCQLGDCQPTAIVNPECTSNSDCATGYFCQLGDCQPTAIVNPECTSDSQCAMGKECINYKCQNKPIIEPPVCDIVCQLKNAWQSFIEWLEDIF